MALRALYDVPAPAKLNLFLHVVGRRADGYHLLQSLFVPIDWCDTLHFELRADGRLARHDLGEALPADDLCLRAARTLQATSGSGLGADISIVKRIPSGAGMGGGSSDAATTLLALNRLWGLRWPVDRLAPIALGLGADVPFFLGSGPALVEGIGERLTSVAWPARRYAVVKPPVGIETRKIFASPLLGRTPATATIEGFTGDGSGTSFGHNDLQTAAEAECAEVAEAARWLHQRWGNSRMTGSGSAVFASAGTDEEPAEVFPADLPTGWTGKMCRSLAAHPLRGWAAGE